MTLNIKPKQYIVLFFLLLLFIAFIKDKAIDTPARAKRMIDDNRLAADKFLNYRINYGVLFPIGILRLEKKAFPDSNMYSIEANTRDSIIELFTSAKFRIESYFSKEGLPYLYLESSDVIGDKKDKKIYFDQDNLLASRDDAKIKLDEPTYDPLGAFIYLISRRLETGTTRKVPCLSKQVLYIMKGDVIEVKNGVAKIAIDIRRQDRTSNHGASFYVWVTADEKRIPLVFKSWTPIGYVTVILEKPE